MSWPSWVSPPPTMQPILSSLVSVTDKQKLRDNVGIFLRGAKYIGRAVGLASKQIEKAHIATFLHFSRCLKRRGMFFLGISVRGDETACINNQTYKRRDAWKIRAHDRNTLIGKSLAQPYVPFNLRRLISLGDGRPHLKAAKRGVIGDRNGHGLVQYRTAILIGNQDIYNCKSINDTYRGATSSRVADSTVR